MTNKLLMAGDMFYGAGGWSAGLLDVCTELNRSANLLAVNHWPQAIATHSLNNPGVRHLCENLDNVEPRRVVPGGKLDILLASPECTHHSRARGGKPMSDQSRASAWHVLRWCEALRVESVLVENVKEFTSWGPLDKTGRPMKSKAGALFRKFLECFDAMGYRVDYKVLNSAHYGAATTRERLFIQAVRGRRPKWPERTHSATPNLLETQPYVPARDIIDWDLEGTSIFQRKKPLSPKTLKRIEAGLRKFCVADFVLGQQSCSAPRSVDGPIPTIATAGAISLVQPFLVVFRNHGDGRSLGKSLPALTTGNNFGLCQPFLINMKGQSTACDVDKPLPTITAHARHLAVCEPFIVGAGGPAGQGHPHSVNEPLGTVLSHNHRALVEPFIVAFRGDHAGREDGQRRVHSVDEPLRTLDTSNRYGLAQPYLVSYYGTGHADSVEEPLATVTTRDRFGLCEPEPVAVMERDGETVYLLDIRFRMLQPHELAAAMGMEGYQFTGTKADRVKMIGNAVERNTGRALCRAVLQ